MAEEFWKAGNWTSCALFRENSEYVFVASCIFRELSQRGISSLCDMLEEPHEPFPVRAPAEA